MEGGAGSIVLNIVNAFPMTDPQLPFAQSFDVKGFTGGGQAGYNKQIDRSWVVGIETDLQYSDVKGSAFHSYHRTGDPISG